MCPHCKSKNFIKRGYYPRFWGKPRRIKRFLCRGCFRSFSAQSTAVDRKEYKSFLNGAVYRHLMSGVSQRRCARILGIDRKTVARKMKKLAEQARFEAVASTQKSSAQVVVFDEMETFEHSKKSLFQIHMKGPVLELRKARDCDHGRRIDLHSRHRTLRDKETVSCGKLKQMRKSELF